MAKFRQGNLVLQFTQEIIQGGVTILNANAVLDNLTSIQMKTGSQISKFSSDANLGASDSIVSTQAAVKTYVDTEISAFSTNSISQNNSKIEVTDSGSNGTIVMEVDGAEIFNATDDVQRLGLSAGENIEINQTASTIVLTADNVTASEDLDARRIRVENGNYINEISNDSTTNISSALLTSAAIHELSLKSYLHTQDSTALVWTVVHNLGTKYVNVDVIVNDKSMRGTYNEPQIEFISTTTLTCTFTEGNVGVCYCIGG